MTGHLARLLIAPPRIHASGGAFEAQRGGVFASPGLIQPRTSAPVRNVFACLVHESPACVIDLVRNLHYLDPTSLILLYNGGNDPSVFDGSFPFERYSAIAHPDPKPQSWGRLHGFALDCMGFVSRNFPFDTLTIVDSDQSAVRPGYSQYLAEFLCDREDVGLLTNEPGRRRRDTTSPPARSAHDEIDLWRPFLQRFEDGESRFVHSTFWPTTVFTADAVRELLLLFDHDRQLQDIMERTEIFATEEVVLPTLVALLGLQVVQNPCSYELVRFREDLSVERVSRVVDRRPDVFWAHSVPREMDHPLRVYLRDRYRQYRTEPTVTPERQAHQTDPPCGQPMRLFPILERMRQVEGRIEEYEADLLVATAARALQESPEGAAIVEVGSGRGRTTVALACVVQCLAQRSRVFAVDGPGADTRHSRVDDLPSRAAFHRNVERAGLARFVRPLEAGNEGREWHHSIALLCLDGTRDHEVLKREFERFENHLLPAAFVAVHGGYELYSGSERLVQELLESDAYVPSGEARRLRVFQRRSGAVARSAGSA